MKLKYSFFLFILLSLGFMSCSDEFGEQNINHESFVSGSGVFIMNEGSFGVGNGSLSFYSFSDAKVYQDVFFNANNRPLGDLPSRMVMSADIALLPVNNSGKIEVFDPQTIKSKLTIGGLSSPRRVLLWDDDLAIVSDLANPKLTLVNPKTGDLLGKINLGRSSEAMLRYGNLLVVSNWSNFYVNSDNRFVMVVDIAQRTVIDSVEVGLEPESMVIDKNGHIWVLCSGGWDNSEYPTLIRIGGSYPNLTTVFTFPDKNSSPSNLCINGTRDTLFFLNQGVYKMSIDDNDLPGQALIPSGSSYFYSLGVHPLGRGIFVSDPLDFQQNGIIRRFDHQGRELDSFRAGIIPGGFCFN